MKHLFVATTFTWVTVLVLVAEISATSVLLVTLTVSGTFEVLPNRTISINRPSIDPSSIPVNVNVSSSSTSPSPSPTATPPPKPSDRPKSRRVDKRIVIGLLGGILGPIAIAVLTAVILHLGAWKVRRDKGISSGWHRLFSVPRKGKMSKAKKGIPLAPSNAGVSMTQRPTTNSTIPNTPPARPSSVSSSLGSVHGPGASSSSNSITCVLPGAGSSSVYYCLQHRCRISPLGICTSIWESPVPPLLCVRTLPPAHQDYYLVARDESIHWSGDRLENHMDHVDVVTTGLSQGTHYTLDYRVAGEGVPEPSPSTIK
ncbi:hypothetical protein P154DRAFT_21394 [Amniculicola lignicola CBS 123094]|uniref:Uncharacterized protein n=1 Tax=Amniculicola lignicola CBS 123094 TaxID=1392246 RepID=A0A6A5X0G5_9PLEO|nr:hypothetical protein P154DRAFT_21394 [Amniculicola lignicola CBS 123094]